MRFAENDIAEIFQMSDDGTKSTRTSIGTIEGFLKPASAETLSINGLQAGKGFSFFSKFAISVSVQDSLVINSITYTVRASTVNPTSAGYTEIVLEKPVTS